MVGLFTHPPRRRRRAATVVGILISIMLHATAVIGAVRLTAHPADPGPPTASAPEPIIFLTTERPEREPAAGSPDPAYPQPVVPEDWRPMAPSVDIDPSDLKGLAPTFDPTASRSTIPGSVAVSRTGPGGAAMGGGAWRAELVEDPPALLACPEPDYPPRLRAAGFEGRVVVELVIDTSGTSDPEAAVVIESPHEAFTASVLEAVKVCRYRPGRARGQAVRVVVRQAFSFEIVRR